MILKTDFQRGGAGDLVRYIQRNREADQERSVALRDRTGRELSDERLSRFVDKSREFGFQRHMILSPNPEAAFSVADVDERTREFMRQEFGHQPTTDFVYGVHGDVSNTHAHVAATGREQALSMDREEITRLRSRARKIFREPERMAQRESVRSPEELAEASKDTAREQYHERELSLDTDQDESLAADADVHQESEAAQESERMFDFGNGGH